jgi:hypothetical protein
MSSRGMISARQRVNSYRPSNAIAHHILETTVEIDSTEQVLEFGNGFGYAVASKFSKRYYRVTVEGEQWACSASDPRVAAACKASVQAFLIRTHVA